MAEEDWQLVAENPKSILDKTIQIDDPKGIANAAFKSLIHLATGKPDEAAIDAEEAISKMGLETKPGERASLLIRNSIIEALNDLVGEKSGQLLKYVEQESKPLSDKLDSIIGSEKVVINEAFFDRPADLPLLIKIQSLLQEWLVGFGIGESSAKNIIGRFPSYFVYALHKEWRKNVELYQPLKNAIETPFTKAADRELAWRMYSSLLQRDVQEGIFGEQFSLQQIYVPLNAYYVEEIEKGDSNEETKRSERERRRVLVSLDEELGEWLKNPRREDAIRVISGGPGSGKSSFARIFAAHHSNDPGLRILYIPLYSIDSKKDLVEEIGRYVQDNDILPQNPLSLDSPENNLLIIFDGLDELASQGMAAAETAKAFIREIERTIRSRNFKETRLRILISGRELSVQENESEFRHPRQILTLLPYFLKKPTKKDGERLFIIDGEVYYDPKNLLDNDLRNQWWIKYGALTGMEYNGLPFNLIREDLNEITAQPLLNYLIALSFTRGKLDFSKDINLNRIYNDLLIAVYERGYEERRPHIQIRDMKREDFARMLEEISLAAWHGDGRTTTVREIEEHCNESGIKRILEAFNNGAIPGVTRLLVAFFFRQYGQRQSGDPTFAFTHKSFGEFLAAKRIVRAMKKIIRELDRYREDPDEGRDEMEALAHWAQICGPRAISPYIHKFFLNEISLESKDDLDHWQMMLTGLFNGILRHGMPMEKLSISTFNKSLIQSRNAEEALLAALNACARVTGDFVKIEQPDSCAFGAWFKRIQGQRAGSELNLVTDCLSFLDLEGAELSVNDFYQANLRRANLQNARFREADLSGADLSGANLSGADLSRADLSGANLSGAILSGANLNRADLNEAKTAGAIIKVTKTTGANLPPDFPLE